MAARRSKRASGRKPSGSARRPNPRSARPRASTRGGTKPRPAKRRTPARRAAKRPARRRPAPVTAPAPGAAPNDLGLVSLRLDYNSHHVDEVKRFYTEILGFQRFVHDPKVDSLVVTTGPGSSLGFTPPMEGPPEDWRPPREPQLCLFVEDVDATHAMLVRRGVQFLQPPADMPWMHRVARLRDPEGRMVCLVTPIRKEG